MMLRRALMATLVVASGLLLAPQAAEAKPNWIIKDSSIHESRDNKLDIVVRPPWFVGTRNVGAGVWYSIPIVPDGFLPTLNDSFAIEFGGTLSYWWYSTNYRFVQGFYDCTFSYYRLTPLGGVRWDFMLTPEWTVFGVFKAGWHMGFGRSTDCGPYTYQGANDTITDFAWESSVGAYWNFSDAMAMRFEIGPYFPYVGLSINM